MKPDRHSWVFYVCSAGVVVVSLASLWLGDWGGAALGMVLAIWIGAHPYLRRTWYWIGYVDGQVDDKADE